MTQPLKKEINNSFPFSFSHTQDPSPKNIDKPGKVILASYRLPLDRKDDAIIPKKNGGIISAALSLQKERELIWVGLAQEGSNVVQDSKFKMRPVEIDPETATGHFSGFCKGMIWRLFHYSDQESSTFQRQYWDSYLKVNERFAEEIAQIYQPNDLVLIQDYHLMALPGILRKTLPTAHISYFHHIPWPSSELYRALPVRNDLLKLVLEADVVGFQTYGYLRHFLSACTRLLGYETKDKWVFLPSSRVCRLGVQPIGIDPLECEATLQNEETKKKAAELLETFKGKKIIVSRDNMEGIKGIPRKLKAFKYFLENYKEWHGKVVWFLEARPTGELLSTPQYLQLSHEIEILVGSINGTFSTIDWIPIYFKKKISWKEYCALNSISDLCFLTPLRDGMNLTCMEYIACQQEKKSPLILSEFIGAAQCLSGAFLVNPYNEKQVAQTLDTCLSISEKEKQSRFKNNWEYVHQHTSIIWINSLVRTLQDLPTVSGTTDDVRMAPDFDQQEVEKTWKNAKKRLIFLDYDGTLTPIVSRPELAVPTPLLLEKLKELASNPANIVFIVSGRGREFFKEIGLDKLDLGFSCEHGSFIRPPKADAEWQSVRDECDLSWKDDVLSLFEDFTDRTPGSHIETKEINYTWHYRNADPDHGEHQMKELLSLLNTSNLPIDVLVGKKCLEVRPPGVTKGASIRKIITRYPDADFAFGVGDDRTDEDMFEEVNKAPFPNLSVVIEPKPTCANYSIKNQQSFLQWFETITKF